MHPALQIVPLFGFSPTHLSLQALKNFTAVLKHFATFEEDQFDFHSYCVRKMTLRSYISMLRMEDSLLENVYYAKVESTPPVFD